MTAIDPPATPVRVTITGPTIATGVDFTGCSSWSGPGHVCTCNTWRPVICDVCGREIHDGDVIVERVEMYPDPLDDEHAARHEGCNETAPDSWFPTTLTTGRTDHQ